MFGTLPAYGFYLRHARNVTLRDVEVGFSTQDLRPAFVCTTSPMCTSTT